MIKSRNTSLALTAMALSRGFPNIAFFALFITKIFFIGTITSLPNFFWYFLTLNIVKVHLMYEGFL